MKKRPNPSTEFSGNSLPSVFDGIDNLPNPIGVNASQQERANAMPEVDMKTNDGDNPSVASAAFANGRDTRVRDGAPKAANPFPAMPGANQ